MDDKTIDIWWHAKDRVYDHHHVVHVVEADCTWDPLKMSLDREKKGGNYGNL